MEIQVLVPNSSYTKVVVRMRGEVRQHYILCPHSYKYRLILCSHPNLVNDKISTRPAAVMAIDTVKIYRSYRQVKNALSPPFW